MRNSILGLGGSLCALPTPFQDGEVDHAALSGLCARQLASGTSALVVCGSTGEASTFSETEYSLVVRAATQASGGEVPVIAGCTSPCTETVISLAEKAAAAGADALLCAAPPYNKPTQEGLRGHFRALAHSTSLPVVLYHVPSRSGVGFSDETVAWLFDQQLIVGIKDATADLSRPPRLRRVCGERFMQWSGDDATAAAYRAMGGIGCISVTANVTPALCAFMHDAWDRGDLQRFASIRDLLAPLHETLFAESNPIPLEAALASLGLCTDDVRLPLSRATLATQRRLLRVMPTLMPAEQHASADDACGRLRVRRDLIAI